MSTNYNLNIHNKFPPDGWIISFFDPAPETENVYGGVGHRIELDIWMLGSEAKKLGIDLDGDGFWTDLNSFKLQYPEMLSKRIKKNITNIST